MCGLTTFLGFSDMWYATYEHKLLAQLNILVYSWLAFSVSFVNMP